jgi:excisionase family DNA binding protein
MAVQKQIQESSAAKVPCIAVSLDEAARLLSVGETAIFEAISTGRLRTKKLGARTLVLTEDLRKFARELPDRPVRRTPAQSTEGTVEAR